MRPTTSRRHSGGAPAFTPLPMKHQEFYWAIAGLTAIAVLLNFLGFNPMRALVWSEIAQGFSTPPLLLLIMFMTNSRRIMGDKVNAAWMTRSAGSPPRRCSRRMRDSW